VIQPANPVVVYVPAYDPWYAYGPPLVAYPGWVPVEGVFIARPGISFGIGFGVGIHGGFGWGWNHWETDWHDRRVFHDGRRDFAHEHFEHRADFHREHGGFDHRAEFHGGAGRVGGFHGGVHAGAFHGGGGFHGGGHGGGGGRR